MGLKFRKFHFFSKKINIFLFSIFNFKFKFFKFKFLIFLIFKFLNDSKVYLAQDFGWKLEHFEFRAAFFPFLWTVPVLYRHGRHD
jgi:hypothetical protein